MQPVFARPEYLLFGLLAVLIAGAFFLYSENRAWKRLYAFAEQSLLGRLTGSYSRRRMWIKNSLLLAIILLLFVSLARPQWGADWEKAETRGIDIMIALDTSRSMLAEDISPNRLERSKLAILDLVQSLQGDRVGLIAFAGNAFLQCPLTLDYQAFRQTLAAVDTDTIPVGGTDVAAAIDEADAYFEASGNDRILILITDGEDLEASGLQRARESAKSGMRILTVGVGSTQGELIPIRNAVGDIDYLRDASGKPVSTSLDEQTLRRIADVSSGFYAPLGPAGGGLDEVYQFCLAQIPAEERQESLQRIPIERFHWALLVALLLLVIESLLSTRSKRYGGGAAASLLLCLGSLATFLSPTSTRAGTSGEAAAAFREGKFEESATLYREASMADPNNPKLIYNLGVANYRSGQFSDAIANFEMALRLARPGLQERIFHNTGTSRVALGFNLLDEDPVQTRDQWMAAITDFENALSLDGGRADSLRNLEQIKATIAAHTYSLTILALPPEGGTVTESMEVFHNIPYPVEAVAAEGYVFSEWTGEGLEDPAKAATIVRLQADGTLTAQFAKTWRLTVVSEDPSMGTAEKSGTYREDQPVQIKAQAEEYFAFTKWSSEEVDFTDPEQAETEINLTSDATVTASFVPAFKLSVELEPEIGGKAGPAGFFEEYSVVPIQAEPREGFEWMNWVGDGIKDPDQQQTTISLTEDKIAIAKMNRIWSLVIVPNPEEGGTATGAGDHPVGSTVDISASPMEGFSFVKWEGPGVSEPENPTTSVTVQSEEHTLFALFEQDEQDDQQQDQDQDQDQQDQDQDQDQDQSQDQDQQDENQDQDQESEQEEDQQQDQPEEGEQEQDESEEQQPQPDEEQGQPEEQQVEPGEMSREEARQLLNALSESEKFLPAGELSDEKRKADTPTGRDW